MGAASSYISAPTANSSTTLSPASASKAAPPPEGAPRLSPHTRIPGVFGGGWGESPGEKSPPGGAFIASKNKNTPPPPRQCRRSFGSAGARHSERVRHFEPEYS